MPATQAFVLMNLDLIAVPLQVGGAGAVTIYCGARRADQLLKPLAERRHTDQSTNQSRDDADRRQPLAPRSDRHVTAPADRQ